MVDKGLERNMVDEVLNIIQMTECFQSENRGILGQTDSTFGHAMVWIGMSRVHWMLRDILTEKLKNGTVDSLEDIFGLCSRNRASSP